MKRKTEWFEIGIYAVSMILFVATMMLAYNGVVPAYQ